MQRISGNMQVTDVTDGRSGVAGPCKTGNQAKSRRDKKPVSSRKASKPQHQEHCRTETHLRDLAELGIVEDRWHDAPVAKRMLADRCGLQQQPDCTRHGRSQEADPDHGLGLSAKFFGNGWLGTQCGSRDHCAE
jgi:hypothetical protein